MPLPEGPDSADAPDLEQDHSDVTHWLCAAAYARDDHVEVVQRLTRAYARAVPIFAWVYLTNRKRAARQKRIREALRPLHPVNEQCRVPLGHDYVRWVRRRVARGHPVPPQGFHLTPVLQTAAGAELLTHVRRGLLLLAIVGTVTVAARTNTGPLAVLLMVIAAPWAVCYADRLFAQFRMRSSPWNNLPERDHRWWVAARRRRKLRAAPRQRDGLVVPYALRTPGRQESGHHFLGAGSVFNESAVGIDVAAPLPKDFTDGESEEDRLVRQLFRSVDDLVNTSQEAAGGVTPFTPDDLHGYVGADLRKPFDPKGDFHPENRLVVFDVAAVSAERWPDITRTQWDSLLTLARDGTGADGASKETKEARRFLCTRIVSWDGELVASLYISFAYEHHDLRVTVRPHVTNPIHPILRAAVRLGERGGWAVHARMAANAALDLIDLLNRIRRPFRSRRPEVDTGEGPISLREVYSSRVMDDMLQHDDASRYIDWMQRRVFQSVLAFLTDHNVDTGAYMKQVTYVLENSGVINTGVMGDVQNQPGAERSSMTKTDIRSTSKEGTS
ncbi:hypothetical protein [Streptomyces laculatispora]|uniref:hypothetical protein n=1 Tax=Streptomyces laculatispora TaxID=887464 RepID=UPI001A951AC0|nr:hypothetical protein [Streptomyces laculatispora]MBO0915924.1 hypothetical protein [Streptomyces laculatispora]